jgi:hypothetical protein
LVFHFYFSVSFLTAFVMTVIATFLLVIAVSLLINPKKENTDNLKKEYQSYQKGDSEKTLMHSDSWKGDVQPPRAGNAGKGNAGKGPFSSIFTQLPKTLGLNEAKTAQSQHQPSQVLQRQMPSQVQVPLPGELFQPLPHPPPPPYDSNGFQPTVTPARNTNPFTRGFQPTVTPARNTNPFTRGVQPTVTPARNTNPFRN